MINNGGLRAHVAAQMLPKLRDYPPGPAARTALDYADALIAALNVGQGRYRLRNADGLYVLGEGWTGDKASATVKTAAEWETYLMRGYTLEPGDRS